MIRQILAAGLFVVAISLANVLWAQAETKDAAAAVDPTGSWKWDRSANGNTMDFALQLDWNGKELTGQYTAFDNTTPIENAKLENDAISFIAKREFNGNQFTVAFAGKVEPDDITGTVELDRGEGPQTFDWHAKRSVEIDDVLGEWNLHLETPNGPIEPKIIITRAGDALHGDYSSPFGAREAKDLTLKDNELSWTIESNDDDQFDFQVHYTGKPRGNTIAGTNEYDFGGNTGTLDFTGKRMPPDAKPAETPPPAPATPAGE